MINNLWLIQDGQGHFYGGISRSTVSAYDHSVHVSVHISQGTGYIEGSRILSGIESTAHIHKGAGVLVHLPLVSWIGCNTRIYNERSITILTDCFICWLGDNFRLFIYSQDGIIGCCIRRAGSTDHDSVTVCMHE